MKVFVHGLHACLQRRCDVKRYSNYIRNCGHELVAVAEESDIVLLWACAFRKDYCENSLAVISNYQKCLGEEKIVVCGCLPSIDERLLKSQFRGRYFKWRDDNESLNAIFGRSEKDIFQFFPRIIAEKDITDNIDCYREKYPDRNVSYYDQFIKLFVSEGCYYNCAYCTEKLAFPGHTSFPLSNLKGQCRLLLQKSHQDKVALIADSLGDYGKNAGSSLAELIEAILSINKNVKVGLMNLHPADFITHFDYLIDCLKKERIFHLNLPIQSASDRILKLMNRSYIKKDLNKIFCELGNMNFRECETHLLIGFPSESDDDFQESLDFILQWKPKYIMASAYMETDLLESSKLPGKVSIGTINKRMQILTDRMKENGIICNYNTCEYIEEQFRRQRKGE